MNRKAIVSLGAGPQERLLGLAARSFRPYAKRHGYDLHLHTEGVDDSRPLPWSKVRLLQRLQDDYDVLLWLDADLVIVDQRVDLAGELDPARFLGLVEHQVAGGRFPNSGVMALQTGPACRAFLEDVWAQDDLVEHRWWENAAICRLLGYELEPVVRPGAPTALRTNDLQLLDARWNAIHDAPVRRPRIRHYPGYRPQVRAAFMLRDLALSRRPRPAG